MKPLKIAIIGSGYVGTYLAILWTKKGHEITTLTSSVKTIQFLSKIVQKTLFWKRGDESVFSQILASDIIVFAISPPAHGDVELTFLRTAQILKKNAFDLQIPKTLIYMSNTSVYGDHRGLWVREEDALNTATLNGKLFIETENTFLSMMEWGWQICILRLADVYGPGKEISTIIKSLQGKVLHGTGDNFTNMVHQEDALNVMDFALARELKGIYNICDDDHPTQKELYQLTAQRFRLPPLLWDPSLPPTNGNKRISNVKIKKEGYKFSFPHRLII